MSEVQRLFFAAWPSQVQQQAWRELAREWLPEGVGRHMPTQNLHLTLLYLGNVTLDQRELLMDKVSSYQGRPFSLQLDKIGYWRKPQVAWLGSDQLPQELLDLVHGLRQMSKMCGLEVESRPYRAHVTLARKVRRKPPAKFISPISWPIEEFVLVRSQLDSSGAKYDIQARWPLRR